MTARSGLRTEQGKTGAERKAAAERPEEKAN